MAIRAPKGTKDILPEESYKWQHVEQMIRNITATFGYQEIRTPVFEHTELFLRGVGDTTDIVQKEMYTFDDKGGRSITLKPEGTAGVARAFIESGLTGQAQPTKFYYLSAPLFRYERPQSGRLREHHQFGIEVFGAEEPSIDAEVISVALTLFEQLGLKKLHLNINSIGCAECRPKYHEELKEFLKQNYDALCPNCKERYETNPLRILDCKEEGCQELVKNAPVMIDYLCEECDQHFTLLKEYLDTMSIKYHINPLIVRGLDYYTKTVFEIISDSIGAQGTVCGGGRYDGLVAQLDGPKMPGIGFGIGIERLLLTMESENINIKKPSNVDIFVVTLGDRARKSAVQLVSKLREAGSKADMDHIGRGVRAQFRHADRLDVKTVITIGDSELESDTLSVRDMGTGEEKTINRAEVLKNI